ncbi:toprim domain-containing protein, partial [Enterococcus faecium]|uniref:toprim domain-containing protein n=1 Tax=Enterococcus faecium TaxID=1352 RepID=UPI003CC50324
PEDINISSLLQRLHDADEKEVIIATNATTEGEATAMYLSRLIKPAGIKLNRLAQAKSVACHNAYPAEVTVLKAVDGRREL